MRKLDVAIAEGLGKKVVWRKKKESYLGGSGYVEAQPDEERARQYISHGIVLGDVPLYSSDGNAMLELIKEMIGRYWFPIMHPKQGAALVSFYSVVVDPPRRGTEAAGETLPLAVALAAYKALTGKEWRE